MNIALIGMRQDREDPYYLGKKGIARDLMEKWLNATMMKHKDATFLLPVATVFDLTAMHYTVQHRLDARLYLPSATWGNTLPAHRQASMTCIKAIGGCHVCNGKMDRMQRMVDDADLLIVFTDGEDDFVNLFTGKKPTIWFPWPSFKQLVDQHNLISH